MFTAIIHQSSMFCVSSCVVGIVFCVLFLVSCVLFFVFSITHDDTCVLCLVSYVVFYEACGLCLLQPLCLISRVSRVICVLCRVFLLLCLLYYCWCTVVLPSLGGCVVRHATLTNSHTPSTHIRLEIVFFIAESGTNMTRPA